MDLMSPNKLGALSPKINLLSTIFLVGINLGVTRMSANQFMAHPWLKAKKENFTMIPNELIRTRTLSPYAKTLIQYLCSFPDYKKFNDDELMNMLGCGKGKLYSSLKELRDTGYVMQFGLPPNASGQFMGSVRAFFDEPVFLNNKEAVEVVRQAIWANHKRKTELSKSGNSVESTPELPPEIEETEFTKTELSKSGNSYNNTSIYNTDLTSNLDLNIESNTIVTEGHALVEPKITKIKTKDKPTKEQIEEAFNVYWDKYPRKQGKADALRHFTALLAPLSLPDAQKLSEEILVGLERYKEHIKILQRIKNENPYWNFKVPDWKHGDGWLKSKRWIDSYKTNYEEVYADVAQNNPHRPSRKQQQYDVLSTPKSEEFYPNSRNWNYAPECTH